MKNLILTILAMFMTLAINATETKTIDKTSFDKIYVETPCKVQIVESDTTGVRMNETAKENIYYEIIDNVIYIKQKDNINDEYDLPVIRIYYKKLLNIAASQDLYIVDNMSNKKVMTNCNEKSI